MNGLTQRLSLVSELRPALPQPGPAPIRLSLDGVPERERRAVFREFFGRSVLRYDVEPLPDVDFNLDVKLRALPGLLMMWGNVHGSRNRRTREMLAADGADDIGMIVNLRGPHHVTHGDQELVLGDGEATLVSSGEVCSFTHRAPGDILAFRVPQTQLAPLVSDLDDRYLRRIPSATPALRLLVDYVRLVQDDQRVASPELQHLAAAHIHDLMALAIGATRDGAEAAHGRGLRSARLQAIRNDIARNLDQPDLTVAGLADRHGCTPRFIQRLFEAEGMTFTDYVLTQRLARAHRMLIDPRRSGDKITTIALAAGFADVSYFNRAFRQRYGETPSAVRAQAREYA